MVQKTPVLAMASEAIPVLLQMALFESKYDVDDSNSMKFTQGLGLFVSIPFI